jgi:hypothetical protein
MEQYSLLKPFIQTKKWGGIGFAWPSTFAFKKEMDLDGTADYEQPDIGSTKSGYFRVVVDGANSVTFDYIQSDKNDPSKDGTVAFTKTVYAPTCD